MTREGATAVVIALAVVVFLLMIWGWRTRVRRDSALVAPLDVPTVDASVEPSSFEGFYVATTVHDSPLDRLAVKHLTFRGRVRVLVRAEGIQLEIAGEPTIFLAASVLAGVDRATWTIDRVVERDGLVLLAWRISTDTIVDSYLRLPGVADSFVAAVDSLLPTPAPTTGSAT